MANPGSPIREVTGNLAGEGTQFHSRAMQAGLSTQIIIEVTDAEGNPFPIGAIQTLTPTETRPLQRISEVGTDGVIQIAPISATTVDLAVTRMLFDYQRLPAAFQRGFRHIHAARLPFDIRVTDYNPYQELGNINAAGEDGVPDSIVTVYVNCWLQNYTYTYAQDNYLITESATIWAESVYDATPLAANTGESDASEVAQGATPDSNTMSRAFVTTEDFPHS